jgi:hypothetical protein
MLPHLVHYVLSYGIPLLGGFGGGRLARSRVKSRLGRVICCLMVIVGTVVLQYIGFFIFSIWIVGREDDWTALTPTGLFYGLIWFGLVAAFTAVPLTVVGYLCGSLLRPRSRPNLPA